MNEFWISFFLLHFHYNVNIKHPSGSHQCSKVPHQLLHIHTGVSAKCQRSKKCSWFDRMPSGQSKEHRSVPFFLVQVIYISIQAKAKPSGDNYTHWKKAKTRTYVYISIKLCCSLLLCWTLPYLHQHRSEALEHRSESRLVRGICCQRQPSFLGFPTQNGAVTVLCSARLEAVGFCEATTVIRSCRRFWEEPQ